MGTPEFAIPTLLEISRNGFVPVAVYTRVPAQRGRRGLELRKAPVHLTADSIGIPVFTPISLRDAETQKQFENQAADLALVIAYGLLLPIPILEMPRLGCLNLHASLLEPDPKVSGVIDSGVIHGLRKYGERVIRNVDQGASRGA